MAKADNRSTLALAAAERLYRRRPDASTEEFRAVCERADEAAISKLSNREFNGRYVLPLKRWGVAAKGTKRGRGKTAGEAATTTRHRRRVSKKRGVRGALSPEQKVIGMLRERDAALLDAAGDASKVYDVASRIDEFAAEIVKVATG